MNDPGTHEDFKRFADSHTDSTHPKCIDLATEYQFVVLDYGRNFITGLQAHLHDPDSLVALAFALDSSICREDPAAFSNLLQVAQNRLSQPIQNPSPAQMRGYMLLQAYLYWSNQPRKSLQIFGDILKRLPTDLYALKRFSLLAFRLSDMQVGLLAYESPEYFPEARKHMPYVPAGYAFALEQVGRFEEAHKVAAKAIERDPKDPWAVHSLIHALMAANKVQAAYDACETHAHAITEPRRALCSFMMCHFYWHKAIAALALDNVPESTRLLCEDIWVHDKLNSQDQLAAGDLCVRILMEIEERNVDGMMKRANETLLDVLEHVCTSHTEGMFHLLGCVVYMACSLVDTTGDERMARRVGELKERCVGFGKGSAEKEGNEVASKVWNYLEKIVDRKEKLTEEEFGEIKEMHEKKLLCRLCGSNEQVEVVFNFVRKYV